jgi:type IV pilus assembly protein PilW
MKSTPRRFRGVSLIELMISIALGIVVVGTVIALYIGSSDARRQAQAFAEMNDDGLYAVRILTQQIRLSGFNPLQPSRPLSTPTNPFPGGTLALPVFGCSSAFSNAENDGSGTYSGTASHLITCDATQTASHSIAITYEADIYNTLATAANLPTDCLGTALTLITDPAFTTASYYIAENRYYVKNNGLYCAGSGGSGTNTFTAAAQPLVANVEQLNFLFGVMPASATNTTTIAAGYLTAAELGNSNGLDASADGNLITLTAPQRWSKVVSVKVCVLMRSATQVLKEPQAYFPCNPALDAITPSDRFARRAFISTVNLRNSRP